MNSNLDPAAFSAAYTTHEETDCGTECGPKGCVCLEACIRAYVCHIAASPPDLRSVLAYDAGVAEGRRQGLEEAAKFVDCGCVERAAVLAAATSAGQQRACGRIPCAAAEAAGIRALIKEPKS